MTAPSGFSFTSANGNGTYTKVNNRTITWNPKLTNKVGTSSINMSFDVNVTYPSGSSSYTGTFTLVESLYSGSKSFSATITDRPSGSGSESEDYPYDTEINTQYESDKPYRVPVWDNDPFPDFDAEIWSDINKYLSITGPYIKIDTRQESAPKYVKTYVKGGNGMYIAGPDGSEMGFGGRDMITWKTGERCVIYSKKIQTKNLEISIAFGDTPNGPWELIRQIFYTVDFVPTTSMVDEFDTPYFTVLEPSEEEYNRLGSGYTYICQSDMNVTTTDTTVRDWYKNNRIGVCNTLSSEATEEEIYQNAIWSKQTGGLNEYNNVEVEFTYDKTYPVYIVLTGDYQEATTYSYDIGTLQFTEPCIIEKELYTNRLPAGVYPVPIRALLGNDETATLTLEANQSGDSVILYDLPLDDDYGTNEDYAIRGVKVTANVEQTDPIVVQAKLHKPNGEIGQRSTVLDSNSTSISIGGLGDLWGFTTLQLTNLEDWEIELSASNILTNTVSTINFNDVSITFYIEPIIKQEISVLIEDENLAYYGAFIEEIKIPEGLKTDTSYLNVDGTDTNDAYRQNIREKEIEIQFNLSNCDLQTSTDMLRQLAKLFTNEKDQYNRPIPKHLRLTHYPNDYFEYIMEEPFDVDTELTDYNVKAKLTIPSGTSYSLEDTVTNTVGNANGLAPLNPIIRIRPSSSNIQIKENNSEQSFQMGYTGDWNEYTVEIDCEDRVAYLVKDEDTKIDISKYVDHNSDWFRLSGEYEFEGINCTILTVRFNERW